jgi:predicted  nucleic acid-binding Zn-ribbon protein
MSLTGCAGKSVGGEWIITQSSDMNEVGTKVLFTEDGWMDYGGERYQYEQTNETTLELKGMLSTAVPLEWRDDGTLYFNGLTLARPDTEAANEALATKAQIEEQQRAEEEAARKAEEEARQEQQEQQEQQLKAQKEAEEKQACEQVVFTVYGAWENYIADLTRRENEKGNYGNFEIVAPKVEKTSAGINDFAAPVGFLQGTKDLSGEPLLKSGDYACPTGGSYTIEWGKTRQITYVKPAIYCSIHSPKE